MRLSSEDFERIEEWLDDASFVNWATQSNPVDMVKWELYFNEHPEHWGIGKAGRTVVVGVAFRARERNDSRKKVAFEKLMDRLDDRSSDQVITLSAETKRSRKWWYMAAAVAAVVIFASSAAYQFFKNTEVIYATEFGEQRTIELPDESIVTLNANSQLKYYSQSPRKVWLDGEAFFEVRKQLETNANFLVHTPDLTVTVLGTAFNVNTRNDQTKVFLDEGKVNLAIGDANSDAINMDPGDLITYSKASKELQEKRGIASVIEVASWKDGTLIFKNTPLYKAVYEIEDIYGIQFVWESDELKAKVISGGVPIRDLETTLYILQEVYHNEIEKKGNRYFITEKSN